ncbi:MAG: type II toxin-antitoxin system HicB family antitoxin [Candidatus Kapabacteria bacterium]|nr:type II toxin-antitoxin system HicB family antitoxin [Candidatus Kapabacteria bacterium]
MKIVIEKHSDGYCGYPLGFSNGAIVGQGRTYLEALESTNSSLKAFIEYFGIEEFNSRFTNESEVEAAFIAEAEIF